MDALQADHVLIELVERNLDWLIRYVPVMPAPARGIEQDERVIAERSVHVAVKEDSKHELVYVSGELDVPYNGESVFLLAGDAAFETFVTENDGRWSFHAYLSQEQSAKIESLCIKSDTALLSYPILVEN